MQVPACLARPGEPFCDLGGLVGGEVVEHHVDIEVACDVTVEGLEEREHVGLGVTLRQLACDLAAREVHRGKQVKGAVALVVVGTGLVSSSPYRQSRLRAVECLSLGLFVEREHGRSLRRVEVEADDVPQFRGEVRVA